MNFDIFQYTKNKSQFNFPVFSISVIMNNIDVV